MGMAGLIHTLVWPKFGVEDPKYKLLLKSQYGRNREKEITMQCTPSPNPYPPHPTPTQAVQQHKKNWATSVVRDNSSHFQSWGHTTPKQQCHFISDSKVPIRYEDNLCFQNRELINHCKVVMGGGECVTHMFWQMKPTVFLCVPKCYHSSETTALVSWNRRACRWKSFSFKHRTRLLSQL